MEVIHFDPTRFNLFHWQVLAERTDWWRLERARPFFKKESSLALAFKRAYQKRFQSSQWREQWTPKEISMAPDLQLIQALAVFENGLPNRIGGCIPLCTTPMSRTKKSTGSKKKSPIWTKTSSSIPYYSKIDLSAICKITSVVFNATNPYFS